MLVPCFVTVTFLHLQVAEAKGWTIELRRHQDSRHVNLSKISVQNKLSNRVLKTFQINHADLDNTTLGKAPPSSSDRINSSAAAAVSRRRFKQSFKDVSYMGALDIGTPKVLVKQIQFDTGSTNLWISDTAFSLSNSQTWQGMQDHTKVSEYMDGTQVIGIAGKDSVCLPGSPSALCVEQQEITSTTHARNVDDNVIQGILGLGLTMNDIDHDFGVHDIFHPSKETNTGHFVDNLAQQFHSLSYGFSLQHGSGSYVMFGEQSDVLKQGHIETHSRVVATAPLDFTGSLEYDGWKFKMKVHVKVPFAARRLDILEAILFVVLVSACVWFTHCRKCGTCARRPSRELSADSRRKCLTCTCHCCARVVFLVFIAPLWVVFLLCVSHDLYELPIIEDVLTEESFNSTTLATPDTGTSNLVLPKSEAYDVSAAMFGDRLVDECLWVPIPKEGEVSELLFCMCDIIADVRPLNFDIGGVRFQLAGHDILTSVQDIIDEAINDVSGKARRKDTREMHSAMQDFQKLGFNTSKSNQVPLANEICFTNLISANVPFWVLGDAFMQHFFVAYNFQEGSMSFFPRAGLKYDKANLTAQVQPPTLLISISVAIAALATIASGVYRHTISKSADSQLHFHAPLLA
jgi:hypothetical protein